MYKSTFKIIIALTTFFSIFLVKVHSANCHDPKESLVENKINVPTEVREEIRAGWGALRRDLNIPSNTPRTLFQTNYHDQFTELYERIKKARYEYYNKCTHGGGLFGIVGRSVLYGISLGRICIGRDYELLDSKNSYYSSFSLPAEIFCDEDTMKISDNQKLSDMEQELQEINEKIANTSSLKKILVWII